MERKLYKELAQLLTARKNCAENNPVWFAKHTETIQTLVQTHLPSGSGFDRGTTLDLFNSHANKLIFDTSFQHMNEAGVYDGWTEHTVTVTPDLQSGFRLRIGGNNRNFIKDLIHDLFSDALETNVLYDLYVPHYPKFSLVNKWEDEQGNPSQCYQAWYVGTERFWNRYTAARDRAAELAYNAHLSAGAFRGA